MKAEIEISLKKILDENNIDIDEPESLRTPTQLTNSANHQRTLDSVKTSLNLECLLFADCSKTDSIDQET